MRASGTLTVEAFAGVTPSINTGPVTGATIAPATMEKHLAGDVPGCSTTVFAYALGSVTESGGYVAMEPFEGSDPTVRHWIRDGGGIAVDADGTHRV